MGKPKYDSPLLQSWVAALPASTWGIVDFRRDITPARALVAVTEVLDLPRPDAERGMLTEAQGLLEHLIQEQLGGGQKPKVRIPQHQNKSWNHGTPAPIVDAARATLGGIELDPASSAEFNQIVGAENYFTEGTNGLTQAWRGRVFINPPGGAFILKESETDSMTPEQVAVTKARLSEESRRWGTKSRACAWWRKLVEEFDGGRVRSAIFVGFTLEILRSAQGGKWAHPFDFSYCVPSDRLEFNGKEPTHANIIVYLGAHNRRFRSQFEQFGRVVL